MPSPSASPTSPSKPVVATMNFPDAIRAVIDGHQVTKQEWQNPGIYVYRNDGFLKIHKADGSEHALMVSDGDLLGTDWLLKTH